MGYREKYPTEDWKVPGQVNILSQLLSTFLRVRAQYYSMSKRPLSLLSTISSISRNLLRGLWGGLEIPVIPCTNCLSNTGLTKREVDYDNFGASSECAIQMLHA